MRLRFDSFRLLIAAALLMALAAPAVLRARQADPAEIAFEAARKTEVVDQNLMGAIAKYRDVLSRYSTNRVVAANALARLAACYEQLGQPEARVTYQRIVREFADVPDVAASARTKIAAMAAATAQRDGLTPRRVLSVEGGGDSDVSPSGAQIVSVEGQNQDLVLRDLQTGQRTVLVAGSGRLIYSPVFSTDGRQVAFVSAESGPNYNSTWFVGVIGTEAGARPKDVIRAEAGAAFPAEPIAWSADGRSVLIRSISGQGASGVMNLAWVSVSDRAVRVVQSLGPRRPMSSPRLSPDGQFIAYSSTSGSGETPPTGPNLPRRLFVASMNGTGEAEVVKMVGSHTDPVWTPDGSHLLFKSDRFGSPALWSVPIQGGKAVGVPSVVQSGFASVPLRLSSSGTLYYADWTRRQTVTYIAERGAAGGRVVTSFPGGGGDWSPNGKSFAFRPMLGNGSEVVVRSMETGEERSFTLENMNSASPHWLGNGGFIVNVLGESPGLTIYFIDAETGQARRLFAGQADGIERRHFATADDGSRVYLFVRTLEQGSPWTGVVAVDPDTGENGPIATFPTPLRPGGLPALGIDVTPDGSSIVGMITTSSTTARLFTIRVDGTGYREVGQPFPALRAPDLVRWTPDGQSILYVSTENGRSRVMRIPASGGTPEFEGIDVGGQIWNIDPSPDGSRLAYGADEQPAADIWAIDNILLALNSR